MSTAMSPDQAKNILRQWAHKAQIQYRIYGIVTGLCTVFIISIFTHHPADMKTGFILTSFFALSTVFLWLKSAGKWGSNYIEKMEYWIHNPDLIVSYHSQLVHKTSVVDVDDMKSYTNEAMYKITFTLSDKTQTSIKITLSDKRSFLLALNVVFPQLAACKL